MKQVQIISKPSKGKFATSKLKQNLTLLQIKTAGRGMNGECEADGGQPLLGSPILFYPHYISKCADYQFKTLL